MIQETFNLQDEACHSFVIYDAGGDGIQNPGFYLLYYGSNTIIAQGTDFGVKDMVDFNTADVVGLEEVSASSSISVYPNPVIDKATLLIDMEHSCLVNYKIYSITGQKIAESADLIMDAGQHGIIVDASAWNPGLYIYQVKAGDKIFTGKMTVQ
jgi:hypothetical protein